MSECGYAIWLYGSYARGITDCASDLDILVVSDSEPRLVDLQRNVRYPLNYSSVSIYTWSEVERMTKYGSLFLHHVRLEGVPLYESDQKIGTLRNMLDNLGEYELATRDIRGFWSVLTDVSESLETQRWYIYDMALLGTIIRHASILGCWLLGIPKFARYEPVRTFARRAKLGYEIADEFPELYNFRLYVERRLEKSNLGEMSSIKWLQRTSNVIHRLAGIENGRKRSMSTTHLQSTIGVGE